VLAAITIWWIIAVAPTVSLEPPIDPANVLTTRFVFANDGPFTLKDVHIELFNRVIGYADGGTEARIGRGFIPPARMLNVGQKETVPYAQFGFSAERPITSADIALIAFFTPKYIPFWHRSIPYRFTTVRQKDGLLRLEHQPEDDVLQEYWHTIELAERHTKGVD
jgi:hypothetical protein